MPIFFFVIGVLMLTSGVRGTASQLSSQLISDVKGFLAFGTVILILGGVGAIKELRGVSKALLVLVFVVFFLKNGNNVVKNIKTDTLNTPSTPPVSTGSALTAPQPVTTPTTTTATSNGNSTILNNGQLGGIISDAMQYWDY